MRAFLAVSVAPHAAGHLRPPVPAALGCLGAGQAAGERVDEGAGGWVAVAGGDAHDLVLTAGGGFTVRLCTPARARQGDLSTAELAAMMVGGADLARVLPPFAAAHRDGPGAPVT